MKTANKFMKAIYRNSKFTHTETKFLTANYRFLDQFDLFYIKKERSDHWAIIHVTLRADMGGKN